MLVVCALALVAAAAVYLVMGLVDGAVGDLYLSMGLCAASLLVLVVSARVSRVRPSAAPDGAPAADRGPQQDRRAPAPAAAPVPVASAAAGAVATLERTSTVAPLAVDQGDPDLEVEVDPEDEVEADDEPAASMWAPTAAEPFPIADYDTLAPDQVLPLIGRLWPEEIPVVAARERATAARPVVLDALAEEAGDARLAFPIAEYATLDTAQITPLLVHLERDDLEVVRSAERAGDARVGVLVAVANQLATHG